MAKKGEVTFNYKREDKMVKTKWEYRIEVTTKDYSPDLNKIGVEGWELIIIVTLHKEAGWQDYKYIFKRRM